MPLSQSPWQLFGLWSRRPALDRRNLAETVSCPDGAPGLATLGKVDRVRQRVKNLVGPDPKRLENMGSERIDERDIRRVAAPRDDNPANPRHIVAGVERPPRSIEEHLDPGAEIHRIDDRHADVAEMAVDVARGNVEASAKRHREMGEIAADAD